MLRVILFDLDGTLMDTAPELAGALNDALASIGQPPVAEELVRGWIGDGARALLGKALRHLGASVTQEPQAWAAFVERYAQRCGTNSRVHDGVRAMLRRLRVQGFRTVLLTNKEGAFAQRLLALHDLLADFDLIVAGDTLDVKKPHPGVVSHALRALHVEAAEALLVGDSTTDVRTARAAGIAVQLVRHGYPQGALAGDDAPDGFIDHFDHFDPRAGSDLLTAR